jgi:hypothetical protein
MNLNASHSEKFIVPFGAGWDSEVMVQRGWVTWFEHARGRILQQMPA